MEHCQSHRSDEHSRLPGVRATLRTVQYLPLDWQGERVEWIEMVFDAEGGPGPRVVVPPHVFRNWNLLREAVAEQASIFLPATAFGATGDQLAAAWELVAQEELDRKVQFN